MSSSIEIQSLFKSFDDKDVLIDFNLEIKPSQFVAILGPSGCGKSTLLRIISGLEYLDSGKVFLNNEDITNFDPKDRDIAMVFQNYALYPHKSVHENLTLGLKLKKVEPSIITQRLNNVTTKLNIKRLLDRKPGSLSGGEMQRVAVARALMKKPSLFLFDEPLSNLDANLRDRLRDEIKRLHKELGMTMIYVTHDQLEAMSLGDLIVVMNDGSIQQIGTPEQIYSQPVNVFVAEFIGNVKMNILEINILDDGISFGDIKIKIINKFYGDSKKCLFGIRSGDIMISQNSEYPAKIISADYFGNYWLLQCEFGDHILKINSDQYFAIGESINISFNLDNAHYFDSETGLRL